MRIINNTGEDVTNQVTLYKWCEAFEEDVEREYAIDESRGLRKRACGFGRLNKYVFIDAFRTALLGFGDVTENNVAF